MRQHAALIQYKAKKEVSCILVKDIEKAILSAEKKGASLGKTGINKSALVHLCRRLENGNRKYRILSLGSSEAITFWNEMSALELLSFELTIVGHDQRSGAEVDSAFQADNRIRHYILTLKQLSNVEREEIFACPEIALSVWDSYGRTVPADLSDSPTIHNTFYAELDLLPLELSSVDVLIVDGPNGNGRSLAFPLLCKVLKPDALMLIDDFDHYPFLDDLSAVYKYDELYREVFGDRRWSIVRVNGLNMRPGDRECTTIIP